MYIHMFAFRWKAGVTAEQKARVVTEIKALQGRIPGLEKTYVGLNDSPRGQGFELGGVMQFADKRPWMRMVGTLYTRDCWNG
jgi:hypothetical protein